MNRRRLTTRDMQQALKQLPAFDRQVITQSIERLHKSLPGRLTKNEILNLLARHMPGRGVEYRFHENAIHAR